MNKKIMIGTILATTILTLMSFPSVVGYQTVKTTKIETNYTIVNKLKKSILGTGQKSSSLNMLSGFLLGLIAAPFIVMVLFMIFMKIAFGTNWMAILNLYLTGQVKPGDMILVIIIVLAMLYMGLNGYTFGPF